MRNRHSCLGPMALALALAFGLTACGGEREAAPSPAPVETAAPTADPEDTATPAPTPSPAPTPTAAPTPGVEPREEATPTSEPTPTPTATPAPTPQNNQTSSSSGSPNQSDDVVLPTQGPEGITEDEYFEQVGVAENVPGAGQPKKWDEVPSYEDVYGEDGAFLNITGQEAYDLAVQLMEEYGLSPETP